MEKPIFKTSERESKAIEQQMGVYGNRTLLRPSSSRFDYKRAELNPSYVFEVLKPFVTDLKPVGENPVILDLGSGKGEEAVVMEKMGLEVIRVDLSQKALKGQENAVLAAGWRLPFKDSCFHGIHCKDMISHVPEDFRDMFLSECCRVLKFRGKMLICGVEAIGDKLSHQYPVYKRSLERLAVRQGLEEVQIKNWQPAEGYKDWYLQGTNRFILELEKPPQDIGLLYF